MREGFSVCKSTARRDHCPSPTTADAKFGKWRRSHSNPVLMCCGFIFIFCAVVTTVSYSFEPSFPTRDDEVWGHLKDLSSVAGAGVAAAAHDDLVKSSRISRRGLSSTALELHQDGLVQENLRRHERASKNVEREEKFEIGRPILSDDSNPLGLAAGLKIFIYELPSKFNTDWLNDSRCSTHLFAAEVALHQILLRSPLRTLDSELADFFFVPVYVSCSFSPKNGFPFLGNARKTLRAAVDLVAREKGYWNRSGGRDHIFVATHDHGTCFRAQERFAADAGVPDFLKESIVLQTFGKKGGHPCQEVENVLIPPYVSPEAVQKYWQPVERQERKIWAYFRGKLELYPKNVSGNFYSKRIRTRLWQKFKTNRQFYLHRKRIHGYQTEMLRAKFCLAPLGWAPWSPRIVESVVYGCVPVIIADDIALPHSHIVDWPSISLTVRERDVDRLDQILQHVEATNLTTVQRNLWKEENRRALLYSQPLVHGDASWQIFNLLSLKKLERSQNFQTAEHGSV